MLAARPVARASAQPRDPLKLHDELELHRIELELQNEALLIAQHETEASLERYRQRYEHAPVGYASLDRSGRIQEANLKAHAIMGIDSPGLVGRPFASFLDQEDADTLRFHLEEVFTAGAKLRCDVVLRNELGQHVAAQIDPAMGEDVCRLVLFDHAALQRAEEGLRAAEAKNRVLLDMAGDAIVVGDAKGRIESLNQATEKMFGYQREELIGRNVRVLVPTSLRREHERFLQRYVALRASGLLTAPNRELIGIRRDGTEFPIEVALGDWWHNGRRKFTAIITDITRRKVREDQLRESEERFRQIAEHVTNVFLFHDRDSRRVTYVSPSFEAICGRPVSELSEEMDQWIELVHPEDRERVAEAYASLWKGARPDEVFRIQQPNGSVRWIRTRVFPVAEPDGQVKSDVCVAEDVTQARELEEKLLQVQKMEAVGTLASSVAHDFNNVLQAILGCLNIARSDETPPDKARHYLDRAAQAAWRGGELASQLMGFARRRRATPHNLRLDAMLKTTKSLLQRLVTEGIVLDVQPGAHNSCVLADPVQVEQILLNLAANARDAMPHGGTLSVCTDTIEIEPEHRSGLKQGRYVRLIVEDNGTGMDERTRARIFEPFFTTKAVGKGTGLGLATVFATCKQLGGHIDVDSAPGKGTRCTLYFPEVPATIRVATVAPQVLRLTGKVLLVEDEPLVRTVTRHHLEEIGLEVLEACDANEALEITLRERGALDALVLDAVLPRISGPKLAGVLRRQHPQLAVLYVTGNPDLMNLEAAEHDRVGVLRKPFGKEELAAGLAKLLRA